MSGTARHAFFDASVYLALYGLPPKDLEQVRKLVDLVESGHLIVYLTSQVEDEFRRRRAAVIDGYLEHLRDARLSVTPPAMIRGTPEALALLQSVAAAERGRAELCGSLLAAAKARRLPADELLEILFQRTQRVACDQYLDAASTRRALGKPPGKKASLGDAVNWEALLSNVQYQADLCLVTQDSDFASPLDREEIDEYLSEEWLQRRCSQIRHYRDFLRFLDVEYPGFHLATDVWKHMLIEALGRSESFNQTHEVVHKLAQRDFSAAEARQLLTLAMQNSQVRWIARDPDVKGLIDRLIAIHEASLPPLLVAPWQAILSGAANALDEPPSGEEIAR